MRHAPDAEQREKLADVGFLTKQGWKGTWMAKVMGNGSDVTSQQGHIVDNAQIPETARMANQHVGHVQHCSRMCPAIRKERLRHNIQHSLGSLMTACQACM